MNYVVYLPVLYNVIVLNYKQLQTDHTLRPNKYLQQFLNKITNSLHKISTNETAIIITDSRLREDRGHLNERLSELREHLDVVIISLRREMVSGGCLLERHIHGVVSDARVLTGVPHLPGRGGQC